MIRAPQETPTPTPAFPPFDSPDSANSEVLDGLWPVETCVLGVAVLVATVGVVVKSVDIQRTETACATV